MATLPPDNNGSKKFVPHVAGRHLGVLADVYSLERCNNFHGKADARGEIDNRETSWSVFFVFLTDKPTEDGKPSYLRQEYGFSYGDNSKLKKMLLAWIPALRNENLWKFDLDRLIGTGADLASSIKPNRDPNKAGYAQVDAIMAPRPTDEIPAIPGDFKRADSSFMQMKEDERTKAKFPHFIVRRVPVSKPASKDDDFMAGLQQPAGKGYASPDQASVSDDSSLPF